MEYKDIVLYLGERPDIVGRIQQVFRDSKGTEVLFSGIKSIWPGTSYHWNAKEGRMQKKPEPAYESKLRKTDKEEKDFEAYKEICKNIRLEKRKAMELKKPHKDIVKALELLRPFARNLNRMDLERFGDYLKNQLSKKKIKS